MALYNLQSKSKIRNLTFKSLQNLVPTSNTLYLSHIRQFPLPHLRLEHASLFAHAHTFFFFLLEWPLHLISICEKPFLKISLNAPSPGSFP